METIRIQPVRLVDGRTVLEVTMRGVTEVTEPIDSEEELLVVIEPPDRGTGPRPPGKQIRRLSRGQERRNAELLGGRTQPGSGSSSRAKGDVRKLGEYRGESKFTFSKSYSLHLGTLEKIAAECTLGEKPLLFLDFKDKATSRTRGSFVILHEADFKEILHAAEHNPGPSRG